MTTPFIHAEEPTPFTLVNGDTPLILAGPHNGYIVPKSLYNEHNQPLGLHASTFDPTSPFKRHEACDWGITELFDTLQSQSAQTSQNHTYLSANYSRLVCDLSRPAQSAILSQSSENKSPITGNKNLSSAQKHTRISGLYTPYNEALSKLIRDTKKRYGYAVFIDLHSFTPTWNGENRNVQIGTLACSDNFVEHHISKYLTAACASEDLRFAQHQPYNMKEMPKVRSQVARDIEAQGVWYCGLEIRNDLLTQSSDIERIAKLIIEATDALVNHENKMAFVRTAHTIDFTDFSKA